MTQEQLASRAGIARETVSRWESGAQQPSLESLARLASVAGARLDVRFTTSEPELVALAEDQLELEPINRLKALLLSGWPACRRALSVAADLGESALVIGPTAAALSGAPQRPLDAKVDLLVPYTDLERVKGRLFDLGGWPDGSEEVRGGGARRGRWRVGRARLTVRTHVTGIENVGSLWKRAWRVPLDGGHGTRSLHVASAPDLLEIAECSPWSEDAIYRTGLRAVLTSPSHWEQVRTEQQRVA